MSRPASPSMPTERQIKEAHEVIVSLYPGARVARVGPDGVTFDYPDQAAASSEWQGKPFGAKQ